MQQTQLLKALEVMPITGGTTQRIDDWVVRQVFADPQALVSPYIEDRDRSAA